MVHKLHGIGKDQIAYRKNVLKRSRNKQLLIINNTEKEINTITNSSNTNNENERMQNKRIYK